MRDMAKMQALKIRSIPFLLTAAVSFGSQAATPPSWRLECVGRAELSLPPDVEMAGVPHESFAEEIAGAAMLSEAQFSDGQVAGWNRIAYVNGLILISKELGNAQIADLRSRFSKQSDVERAYLRKRNTSKSRATVVSNVKAFSPDVQAWSIDSRISYLQQLQSHLLYTSVLSERESLSESTEAFKSLSQNTSYRKLFSIPSESGVCLPFAFIKDSGSEPRRISVTYRIKSHPDVTIVLIDASARTGDESVKRRTLTPDVEMDEFWAQYEVSRTGKKVRSNWHVNSKRAIELDGRKGLSSFVDITRKDDSKDVGFLATVQGDPSTNVDAPKLTLFVVREANHARAKGIEPIGEKEFLELAERIASSVHVRQR